MAEIIEKDKYQKIIDQLDWDDTIMNSEIIVDVDNGTVRLAGYVPNYMVKMAAERDAYLVQGVTKVENLLEIKFPPGVTQPIDEDIMLNIKDKLFWDSRINSNTIDVKVDNGLVSLEGKVDSYWKRNLAEELTLSTIGVVDVTNNLEVDRMKDFLDQEIEKDIKAAMRRNHLTDLNRIQVDVTDGIARLTGTVSNWAEKKAVYNIALYTTGVIDVVDDVMIV
ncbi:MAG: BON domain-containing protein [bacterium]